LRDLVYEVRDTNGASAELIEEFVGLRSDLSQEELTRILGGAGNSLEQASGLMDLLLWYSFLGLRRADGTELYSFEADYDVRKMRKMAERIGGDLRFVIHPAFRDSLQVPA